MEPCIGEKRNIGGQVKFKESVMHPYAKEKKNLEESKINTKNTKILSTHVQQMQERQYWIQNNNSTRLEKR